MNLVIRRLHLHNGNSDQPHHKILKGSVINVIPLTKLHSAVVQYVLFMRYNMVIDEKQTNNVALNRYHVPGTSLSLIEYHSRV